MTAATTSPAPVRVRTPAKVNVELRVGPRRADGYHELATVYQALSLYDELTVTASENWTLELSGPRTEGVPDGPDNLAMRAAMALAREFGIDEPVHLAIHKQIPVAGGMAGGSSDAAAALVGCDLLWGTNANPGLLAEIAADLGSDVPFFLSGGTAIGTGRGEIVTPVLAHGRFHWVLVPATGGLSTPEVFGEFDRLRGEDEIREPVASPAVLAAVRKGDPAALAAAMGNDLQPAALSLRPELAEIAAAGLSYGALAAIVSGSGPTVALLTSGHEAAIDVAVALTASGTAHEVFRAHGPVAGTHQISVVRVD